MYIDVQRNNKILELAEKLPFGAKKEISKRTGINQKTITTILSGGRCRFDNLKKVTQVAKVIIKELEDAVNI